MPTARVQTGALVGVDGIPVDVEADIGSGIPAFNIVGLPDTAVQEARASPGRDSERWLPVPVATDHRQPRTGELALT